ncbi:MAG: multi-sensor hybrid histidine kinase [Verrucomicrobiales bacterium]|nr:multi-sensor hybrid histidine kinase [Verrucomicrobiales bacterium]
MLPDFNVLLVDSLPIVRDALLPLAGMPGPLAKLEMCQDLHLAVAAAAREPLADRPALAVVPLAVWQNQDPSVICGALLAAAPDMPVILAAPVLPDAWREWVAAHPAAPRLVAMALPLDLTALRMLGTMVAQSRRVEEESRPGLLPLAEASGSLEARTNELRHSEERFAAAFRAAPYPQAILNFATGQFVEANAAFCNLTGFSQPELLEHSMPALQATGLLEVLRGPHPLADCRTTCRSRTGDLRHLMLSTQPTALGGEPHLMLLALDITERVLLEEQLRQAQKMEAMGQLAAGVAHDFNNILTIIQGHLSLQLATGDFDDSTRGALKETLVASEHAATLTRQLLALSRCQLFDSVPLDLNAVIQRMSAILQRLIGEHIHVEWKCESGLPMIMGDVPGIEQVVMNLVLQARDAMPRGGRLRIATGLNNISASQAAQNPEAREGKFVRFSIVDTGHGMDQRTVERLLGAFAESKSTAQETGSALAAVYSIVKQHGGWIELFSDPGQGTAFFVYLPVTTQSPTARDGLSGKPAKTGLTVLLVEDEPAVRTILRQLLIHCGCTVLEAQDAPSALTLWETEKARIHLLITDIVMPGGMTGHELAARLTDERPDLKVIYSSGYSASLFQEGQDLVPGRNFLPKPYDASSVVTLIRRVAAEREEMLSA